MEPGTKWRTREINGGDIFCPAEPNARTMRIIARRGVSRVGARICTCMCVANENLKRIHRAPVVRTFESATGFSRLCYSYPLLPALPSVAFSKIYELEISKALLSAARKRCGIQYRVTCIMPRRHVERARSRSKIRLCERRIEGLRLRIVTCRDRRLSKIFNRTRRNWKIGD